MEAEHISVEKREIPHIIHYCWFGNNPMPRNIRKYINGWEKKLPGWKFICWTEDNFDIMNSVQYVKDAYKAKKYAFVSDYVRLYALYFYGGVYLDTDVEIRNSFEAFIAQRNYELIAAFESEQLIMTAFIACKKKSKIIGEFLDLYKGMDYCNGSNVEEIPNTVRFTNLLKSYGLEIENREQILKGGDILICTDDYFSGYDMKNSHRKITNNTYTIHHFQSSWKKMGVGEWIKYKVIIRVIQIIIGYDNYDKLKEKLLL